MNAATLIRASLRFHWRTHIGLVLGAAVTTAVLVGALVVGDSVRATLRHGATERLGGVELAMDGGGRFFRAALAGDLSSELKVSAAAGLSLRGTVGAGDSSALANEVQVLGVDESFWRLGGSNDPLPTGDDEDEIVLNTRLAEQLNVRAGQQVILRVEKPSMLSRAAAISPDADEDVSFAIRLTVRAVVDGARFGNFSLQANQIPPYNAFVRLGWLQDKLGLTGEANMLLVGSPPTGTLSAGQAQAALQNTCQLADAGMELLELKDRGMLELRSKRVFFNFGSRIPQSIGILTYLVNEIRFGGKSVPYSMVAAVGPLEGGRPSAEQQAMLWPLPNMADDQIAINDWLAADITDAAGRQVQAGDEIQLEYFVLGPMRQLQTQRRTFRIVAIVKMTGLASDSYLMPDFPGLADSESCGDWRSGLPIDLKQVRKQDEDYWDKYHGTPKAFVSLGAGQSMWANSFGNLTAVRWPEQVGMYGRLAEEIRRHMVMKDLGLVFAPARQQALAASQPTTDFGGLFVGFSVFLIVAALLLTGLLFAFSLLQRREEMGTLLALGWPAWKAERLFLCEAGVLACAGGLLGVLGGIGYAKGIICLLGTIWPAAVGQTMVRLAVEPLTLLWSAPAGVAMAMLTIVVVLRRQRRASPCQLLQGIFGLDTTSQNDNRTHRWSLWLATALLGGAIITVLLAGGTIAAEEFFAAGAMLLSAGVLACHALLHRLAQRGKPASLSTGGLALRNSARRAGRSIATVAMLACGSFLVVAVGANRPVGWLDPYGSGTGGFNLLGQSSMPIFDVPAGQSFAGTEDIVSLQVHTGGQASCLNLNQPANPQILGVDPACMARSNFRIVGTLDRAPADWRLLDEPLGDGAVPAFGDRNTITWALGRSIGDSLDYTDQSGRTVRVRIVGMLANCVLQGSLLISRANFQRLFPDEAGYREFLVRTTPMSQAAVAQALSERYSRRGLAVVPTQRRLAELDAVEGTYLSIFQALGGLGLLLGSVGLGLVVLRNVLERRGELALLRAVGFSRAKIRHLVLSEHWLLMIAGLLGGAATGLLAVLPTLRTAPAEVPLASLGLTLLAVLASGAIWVYVATVVSLRGPLLDALRSE